jgi:hypothetical protein
VGGVQSVVVRVRTHNRGESFTVARQRGWMVESDTGYGARGRWRVEIFLFGCVGLINMVGLKYVRAKWGRLRCGGLDIV